MRIAQISPLYESVPPRAYGGTERVVSWLTEELVRRGHQVTLFAASDSVTKARLVSHGPALRGNPGCVDPLSHHVRMLETVVSSAREFDILHFHSDYLHFPLSRHCRLQQVTTLHGRLDLPDLVPLYREYGDMPVISISAAQRKPLPMAHWVGNVYHGLPTGLLSYHPQPGKYLTFIGRISPEKRPDRVIEIADRCGITVKIAAKVDPADREYFERVIQPLLKNPYVEFLGEIGDHEKSEFLGNALANLYPIDWPEPFGLAMIEAMACGTPTIAFRKGSIPEIIEDGVNGFIVESIDEAVGAVSRAAGISRRSCRARFEERFTTTRMADDYLRIYNRQIEARAAPKHSGKEVSQTIAADSAA